MPPRDSRARPWCLLGAALVVAALVGAPPGRAQDEPFVVTRLDGLASAPFAPVEGAPQILVQSPRTASPRIDVVIHLHGYEGCVEVLAARGPARCRAGARMSDGWDLLGAHAQSAAPSWLVLPQLAFDTRDGSPGRLVRPGAARRLIEDVLGRVAAERGVAVPAIGSVTLTAHSAGFEATIAVVRHGGLGPLLRHVVLFDALYSGVPVLGAWAASDPAHTLVAFHTASGTPAVRSRELAARYRRRLGARLREGDTITEADIEPGRVVLVRARTGHRGVPHRYLAPTLSRLLGQGSR